MKNISKDQLEIINSFSWFFMDALWMTEYIPLSYACILPTILSGIILMFKEEQRSGILVAFSALAWSIMNSIWLVGETQGMNDYLIFCKIIFVLGVASLLIAITISKDLTQTLALFRRLKLKKKI
ncbi:MAG: hypothetical protein CME62_00850 [Halobacteriovoraceae bacterium]|nr:hypothetical protein [Halobacteriovoraceae bacterium]